MEGSSHAKTSSIRSTVSIELRLVTDRQTQMDTGRGVMGQGRQGGRVPHSPTFWIEIRAKVSPSLQLVTY